MVPCIMHVEDTLGINPRRNVRESFCACSDIMQNRIMTAMWSDSVCTAEQSHFLVPLSPSHHHQSLFCRWAHHCCFCCLKWRVAPFFVDFWSWWTWSFGVLIWCSTLSTAPTCSTGWCHDCTGTVPYATSTAPYDTSRLLASTTTTLYSAGAVYDTSTLLVLLPLGCCVLCII